MNDLRTTHWDESYSRKENYIFYPKEEVVRFFNRYIRKRTGPRSFNDLLHPGKPLKGLDFGCGIGRQVVLMEEFGVQGYGVDISSAAIDQAKELYRELLPGKTLRPDALQVLQGTKVPFADRSFDFAISDSVLDSMYFDVAREIIKELDRVTTDLLFVSLIAPVAGMSGTPEVVIHNAFERNTVQSYFDENKIKRLLEGTGWKIAWMDLVTTMVPAVGFENARYHAVLKK